MTVVVIGCGGIGGHLAPNLCRFLHGEGRAAHVVLCDGDSYEPRNAARMRFRRPYEPKADALARELAAAHGEVVSIEPVCAYVDAANVAELIESGSIVFLAVDNHRTRDLVDRHCATLADVTLISGGNDGIEDGQTGTYGNVQIARRRAGRWVTGPLGRYHPEIAEPRDEAPGAASCVELAATSAPQLLFTNLLVAATMLNAFWGVLRETATYEEVYLDIAKNRVLPVERAAAE